ncbi:MAG: glucan ABC transporter ATP-binding protein/ permease, partial [Xanthobacteraceae bacterium]
MWFIRLYSRVFAMLGPEAPLGVFLAFANVALAVAQFVEPVLFGRIIDTLVGAQAANRAPAMGDLLVLLGLWAGFGLFAIVSGVTLAMDADRRAHRRRRAVITGYFAPGLLSPLAYHGG